MLTGIVDGTQILFLQICHRTIYALNDNARKADNGIERSA